MNRWLPSLIAIAAFAVTSVGFQALTRGYRDREAAARRAQTEPLATIKRYFPADYAQLEAGLGHGHGSDDVAEVRAAYRTILKRQLVLASPESASAIGEVALIQGRIARQASAAACVSYFGMAREPLDPAKLFSPDILDREWTVTSSMLKQTAEAPDPAVPPISLEVERRVMERAFAALSADERAVISRIRPKEALTSDQYAAACNFRIALIESILAEPEDIRGKLYKASFLRVAGDAA